MTAPITIKVVAMSDRGVFIGAHEDQHCVFSLGDTHEISIGDRLRGDFHGHSASTFAAKNLTRKDSPWIVLEDWESPLDGAIALLLKFGSPEYAYAGAKRIATNSGDVVLQLREEILRS